jgi:hypothetical protein
VREEKRRTKKKPKKKKKKKRTTELLQGRRGLNAARDWSTCVDLRLHLCNTGNGAIVANHVILRDQNRNTHKKTQQIQQQTDLNRSAGSLSTRAYLVLGDRCTLAARVARAALHHRGALRVLRNVVVASLVRDAIRIGVGVHWQIVTNFATNFVSKKITTLTIEKKENKYIIKLINTNKQTS